MKTKTLRSVVAFTLGLAAVGTYATFTYAGIDTDGPTPMPAATTAVSAETESTARVNVKALAGKLEFLGNNPALTGHPLLIEFWATWCPPCRASITHLNELHKKNHDRGLQIVGISGEEKATVERFQTRTPMHYAVALDTDQALATEFQVQTIPQAWLLDKDGRIIWSGHPMELDEQTIARLCPTPSGT